MLRRQIAINLKRIRTLRGLKQAQLAEITGFAVNTISRYETGAISPSIEHLEKLAESLDVSIYDIIPSPQKGIDHDLEIKAIAQSEIITSVTHINSTEDLIYIRNEINKIIKKQTKK